MHIRIGVPIFAEDGPAGRVSRIILHPASQEVEGVVASDHGILPHDVVIPIDRIVAADLEGLTVRGTTEEVLALAPFSMAQYTEPPENWLPPTDEPSSIFLFPASPYAIGAFDRPSVSPITPHEVDNLEDGDVDISGVTPVFCGDREVGHLDRVFTEEATDHLTHLVLHRGTLRRDIAVPVEMVSSIGDEGIQLNLTEEELDNLPPIPA
jgi:uncharacterized protein YrrD